MLKVAVLISGRGSNLQALIEAASKPGFPARLAVAISNEVGAEGLQFARNAKIPVETINHRSYASREAFERELERKLKEYGAELICLAGFMRLLTPTFVERWRDRVINIHPSLLPSFPGLSTHEKAIESGVRFSGCTVHFVRAEVDAGPIIIQAAVPVATDDTKETLAARVLRAEHKIYPEAVRLIAEGRVNVVEDCVFITGSAAPLETLINPVDDITVAKTSVAT